MSPAGIDRSCAISISMIWLIKLVLCEELVTRPSVCLFFWVLFLFVYLFIFFTLFFDLLFFPASLFFFFFFLKFFWLAPARVTSLISLAAYHRQMSNPL